jgi:hypothetical protein
MREANGTGANRATNRRIREAIAALGAENARRFEELLSQAQADIDEAHEFLTALNADALNGVLRASVKKLDRLQHCAFYGAEAAEKGDE